MTTSETEGEDAVLRPRLSIPELRTGRSMPVTVEWTGPNNLTETKFLNGSIIRSHELALRIPSVQVSHAGDYTAKVSSPFGQTVEVKVRLVVECEIETDLPQLGKMSIHFSHFQTRPGFRNTSNLIRGSPEGTRVASSAVSTRIRSAERESIGTGGRSSWTNSR